VLSLAAIVSPPPAAAASVTPDAAGPAVNQTLAAHASHTFFRNITSPFRKTVRSAEAFALQATLGKAVALQGTLG
jgi:hypothetical protein